MPFTEDTLATFMATQLGATGRALALSDDSDEIVSAVGWVAAILGAPITSMTDDLKTMTVATWRAWVAAQAASAKDIDLKAGSAELKLGQRFKNIVASALKDALTAALRYPEVVAAVGAEETDGLWDIAEMVLDDFSYRERMVNEVLRGG